MADEEFDITKFGEAVDPVAEAERVDLGRATDLSMLGEAGTDPVGTATELVRSGDIGGLNIERETLMSEFPMEPGESRAAKELPELFTGKNVMNPRVAELEAILDDPEASMWQTMGANMELMDLAEHGEMTQRVGSGVAAHLSMGDKAMLSAAALTMFDPAEVAQMLMQVDPETGERRWPEFAIQHAPDGTIIVANNETQQRAVINRPGFSAHDAVQAIGIGAIFTPAGRVTAAMPSIAGRIATGMAASGATEAAIQLGQEEAGGQFDPMDVALSTALGPIVDIGRGTVAGLQRTGRFIGSYMPESWTKGLAGILPPAKVAVLDFAKRAKEYLHTARPALVLTQDAIPEIHTPRMQILLKMMERLPLVGTGGLRKREALERVEVLRNLGERFNLDPVTAYGHQVIESLNRNAGKALQAARNAANSALDTIKDKPIILRDFRLRIRDIIEKEESYGEMANQGVVNLLNKARNSVWQGGKAQDFARNFGALDDWLQRLRMEARNAPPQARGVLTEAADALERDMKRHAKAEGGQAGAQWVKAMAETKGLVAEAEKKTLKSMIDAGKIDQGIIRKVLKGGDEQQLQTLYNAMTPTGRKSAQQLIMRNALRVGGWRRGMAKDMAVDPKKVLAWMEKPAIAKQLKAFFPDDQLELIGLQEYLTATAAAQEIGKGVGMAAAGGLGQMTVDAVNIATLGALGFTAKAYQSAPVRNLLLRLYHARGNVRLRDDIMMELSPLLMAGGRQVLQQWTQDDPQDSVYIADEYAEDQDPGLMEQLRTAVGVGEDTEDPGVTQRLGEMLLGGEEEPVQ